MSYLHSCAGRRALAAVHALAAAAFLAATGVAAAQSDYPNRTVQILVPFAAGGPSDIVARSIAAKLQAASGQTVVVENKPGANGAVAIGEVLLRPADGYYLLVASIGPFAINSALYPNLPYDPLRDLAPISLAVVTPNVLVANKRFGPNNVAELIDYAKHNPDKVTYGSSGVGSSEHLSIELFKYETKTTGAHVPYRGGAASLQDVLAGHIDLAFQNLGSVSQYIKSGELKALGVTSKVRDPALPDVPTMAEQGYPGVEMTAWHAVMARKGLPSDVVKKLNALVVSALNSPDVKERFAQQGFQVVADTPSEYEAFQKAEIERWKKVVQAAGIKLDF